MTLCDNCQKQESQKAAKFIRSRPWYKKKDEELYIQEVELLEGDPMERAKKMDERHTWRQPAKWFKDYKPGSIDA